MSRRIRKILLVCNSYDSFSLEEDGHIEYKITREYSELNLSNPPSIERAETPMEALVKLSAGDNYDLIIYSAALQTKSNQTVVRIEWANPMGANVPVYCHTVPTIFVSLENPYHLVDVPQVKTFINCYSGFDAVVESLVEKLTGKSEFVGKSPVDAFLGKWETRIV